MPARRAASRSSPTTPPARPELIAEDVTRQRSRGQRQRGSLLHRLARQEDLVRPEGRQAAGRRRRDRVSQRHHVLTGPDAALRLGSTRRSSRGRSRFSRTARSRTSRSTSTSTCPTPRRAAAPTAWSPTPTAASTSRRRSACRSSTRSASATRSSRRRSARSLSSVKFGGANLDELYVTNGDKVFKRKVKTKGVVSWRAPVKPAPPRL